MSLTDAACRNAKPGTKPRKLSDGFGLYLFVQPNGARLWRMNCRYDGKQKTLSFGKYPGVSLREARDKRAAARTALDENRDPGVPRQASGAVFEGVAREWWNNNRNNWVPKYAAIVLSRLEGDIFPEIGHFCVSRKLRLQRYSKLFGRSKRAGQSKRPGDCSSL